jgi:hypothetical protein
MTHGRPFRIVLVPLVVGAPWVASARARRTPGAQAVAHARADAHRLRRR